MFLSNSCLQFVHWKMFFSVFYEFIFRLRCFNFCPILFQSYPRTCLIFVPFYSRATHVPATGLEFNTHRQLRYTSGAVKARSYHPTKTFLSPLKRPSFYGFRAAVLKLFTLLLKCPVVTFYVTILLGANLDPPRANLYIVYKGWQFTSLVTPTHNPRGKT
jgi:hypothetical protein